MSALVPAISGLMGVLVMTIALRRARFLWLPETQMIRAIGSILTKDKDKALIPGFMIHLIMGILFGIVYNIFLQTAPELPGNRTGLVVIIVVCGGIGLVHGLIVTLFLVIAVAQYHPVEEFRKLEPGDMASHVIGHLVYGLTVGFCLGGLPGLLS